MALIARGLGFCILYGPYTGTLRILDPTGVFASERFDPSPLPLNSGCVVKV